MALQKSILTPFGVNADYVKLVKAECKIDCVELMYAIYLDQAARDNNSNPLWHDYITIPVEQLSNHPFETFYTLLKATDVMAGAQDLLSP